MKRLLTLLLLLPLAGVAQNMTAAVGEYQWYLKKHDTLYGGGGGYPGYTVTYANKGLIARSNFSDGLFHSIASVTSGLHSGFCVDNSGNGYGVGDNGGWWRGSSTATSTTVFTPIPTDNLGHAFNNLASVWATSIAGGSEITTASIYWVKKDGTLWLQGNCTGGLQGDSTNGNSRGMDSLPTQIIIPGNPFIVKVIGMFFPLALDSAGNVWDWGNQNYIGYQLGRSGSYLVPHKVSVGGLRAIDIASNSLCSMVLTGNGHIWEWSFYSALMGIGVPWSGTSPITTPTDEMTNLGFTSLTVTDIAMLEEGSFAIMSDGSMRAWGDSPEGTVGSGTTINFTTTTPQYNYDGGQGENIVASPVNPMPCITNWGPLSDGGYFQRYGIWITLDGKAYISGRNKNGQIAKINGDSSFTQEGFYPDWDVYSTFTRFDLNATANYKAEALYCTLNPGATDCHSKYVPPTEGVPSVNAGSNFTTSLTFSALSGLATGQLGKTISQYYWSASGCSIAFDNPFSHTPNVSNLSSGTNTITLTAIDAYGKSASATIVITVSGQIKFYFDTAGTGSACSSGSPCPISLFNGLYATAAPGDSFFLACNETFRYQFVCSASGTAVSPIVLTKYGTGPEPILGGMNLTAGYTNVSGNLWQIASYSGVYPNWLQSGNKLWTIARTPNQTTGSWIPSAMGTNTVTDAVHASSLSVGDTVLGHSSAYTWDKRAVSSIVGSLITVNTNWTFTGLGGLGFFKIYTPPDTAFEYRMNAGALQVYSVGTPTGIYAPAVDTVLITTGTHQVFDHLHFQGGNFVNTVAAAQQSSGNVFSSDSSDFTFDAYQLNGEGGAKWINPYIAHTTDNGFSKYGSNNYNDTVINPILFDIGMQTGMGGLGAGAQFYSGIILGDSGSVIKGGFLDSIGYIGVASYGPGFSIDSLLINKYCQIGGDGGAVYTWKAAAATLDRWDTVNAVTATNGGTAMTLNGTSLTGSSAAMGTYLDKWTSQVLVENCNLSGALGFNIYVHGPGNTFINDKTYGAGTAELFAGEAGTTITSMIVKHCQLGSTGNLAGFLFSSGADLNTYGLIDSNAYFSPRQFIGGWKTQQTGDPGTSRGITSWQGNVGYDLHSTWASGPTQFLIGGTTGTTYVLIGLWVDANGTQYSGSVTVPANQSLLLIRKDLNIITAPRRKIKLTHG